MNFRVQPFYNAKIKTLYFVTHHDNSFAFLSSRRRELLQILHSSHIKLNSTLSQISYPASN